MGKILILDACADASFCEEHELITLIWFKENIISEKYRQVYLYLLEAFDNKHVSRFIADTTKHRIYRKEDRRWFRKNVVPRASEKGLKKAAFVIRPTFLKNIM